MNPVEILQMMALAAAIEPQAVSLVAQIVNTLQAKGASPDDMVSALKAIESVLQPMQPKV